MTPPPKLIPWKAYWHKSIAFPGPHKDKYVPLHFISSRVHQSSQAPLLTGASPMEEQTVCVLLSLCQTANTPIPSACTQKGEQGRNANHRPVKLSGRIVASLSVDRQPWRIPQQSVFARVHSWGEACSSVAQTVAKGGEETKVMGPGAKKKRSSH